MELISKTLCKYTIHCHVKCHNDMGHRLQESGSQVRYSVEGKNFMGGDTPNRL